MSKPVYASRYLVFVSIVVAGTAADLVTKNWIFGQLWGPSGLDGGKIWVWPEYIAWELSLNEGALFGIGQGKVWLFATLSFVAAAGILVWLFVMKAAQQWWLLICLSLVFGGILGNLYDRLGLHGLVWPEGLARFRNHEPGSHIYAVRDWILFTYGGFKWPNFNIADSLLVCGAAMLFVHSLCGYPQTGSPEAGQDAAENKSTQKPG